MMTINFKSYAMRCNPVPAEIVISFPPEPETNGIGDRGYLHVCCCQREFHVTTSGHQVLLYFGAVNC